MRNRCKTILVARLLCYLSSDLWPSFPFLQHLRFRCICREVTEAMNLLCDSFSTVKYLLEFSLCSEPVPFYFLMQVSVRTVETIQTIFISGIDPLRTNSKHNQIRNQYRTYSLFYLQLHNLKGFKIQFINPGSFQGPHHQANYFTF